MEAWSDWECPRCSLINGPERSNCDACDMEKKDLKSNPPKRMKMTIDEIIDLISDDEDDADFKAALAASALEHMSHASEDIRHTQAQETECPSQNSWLAQLHQDRRNRQIAKQATGISTNEPTEGKQENLHSQNTKLVVASLNAWFDEVMVDERLTAMCAYFAKTSPHVIFLQEVTPAMDTLFTSKLTPLGYIAANHVDQAYGEMIFLKGIPMVQHLRYPFSNSGMMRGLHVVESTFMGKKIRFATSHLESLAQYRAQRVAQLKWSFTHLLDEDGPWIFGGDMNLASKDVFTIPATVDDAWIACGSVREHQYTWDTSINKNLPNINFTAKCRFDRLFSHDIRCESFSTFGKELIHNTTLYPSDHWGLLATYSFN